MKRSEKDSIFSHLTIRTKNLTKNNIFGAFLALSLFLIIPLLTNLIFFIIFTFQIILFSKALLLIEANAIKIFIFHKDIKKKKDIELSRLKDLIFYLQEI